MEIIGDAETFVLLYRTTTAGNMRQAEAMLIEDVGCVVVTKSERQNHDGTLSISEASTFVPGSTIEPFGKGHRLVEAL